jgi:uncharacterized protein YmfQ (DUF2313 family)
VNKLKENLHVIGKHLDLVEDNIKWLLEEVFPDKTALLLGEFERLYNLANTGTITVRQNRIISAMRARGGLSKAYFEGIGNTLGSGNYTVSLAEGTDSIGFRIHQYSRNTSPKGPGTIIPGLVTSPPFTDNPFCITATITGSADPETELENLYNRLKPAWT